jgi:hypothetical protein
MFRGVLMVDLNKGDVLRLQVGHAHGFDGNKQLLLETQPQDEPSINSVILFLVVGVGMGAMAIAHVLTGRRDSEWRRRRMHQRPHAN